MTSKLTLWHKITFIAYEKILLQLKVPFSIAPGPIHKIQLRDFDLTQPRDTSTAWRNQTNFPYLSLQMCWKDDFFAFMILWVAESGNVVRFVFAWWRHVMTSCHDVKNRLYSISACWSAREMILFLFLSYSGSLSLKLLSFLCLHDVTNLSSPISGRRYSKMMIHMDFCRYFGWWVSSYHRVCTCMMSSCHNVTSWRRWNYYMTRNELPSSQPANGLESWFHFRFCNFFGGWTRLLSSYLHDGITSRNDVMTSLNILYTYLSLWTC